MSVPFGVGVVAGLVIGILITLYLTKWRHKQLVACQMVYVTTSKTRALELELGSDTKLLWLGGCFENGDIVPVMEMFSNLKSEIYSAPFLDGRDIIRQIEHSQIIIEWTKYHECAISYLTSNGDGSTIWISRELACRLFDECIEALQTPVNSNDAKEE